MIPYDRVSFILWDKRTGERLKAIRDSKDLTREELVQALGGVPSYSTLRKLEEGKADSVSRENIDAILAAMQEDITALFQTVTIKNV